MRTTVSLDDDLAEHVDDVRAQDDDPDAEAIRECIRRSQKLDDVREELGDVKDDLEAAEARADDLRRQLAAREDREEDVGELAQYVEDERRYRRAGLAQRARWWLFGMGNEDEP